MSEIVRLSAETSVDVEATGGNQVRLKLGPEPYGVTLVGDLTQLHSIIIEADRQLTLVRRRVTDR